MSHLINTGYKDDHISVSAADTVPTAEIPQVCVSMPKRILVALDYDKQSEWALDAAAELAVEISACIAFVHVILPQMMASPIATVVSIPLLEEKMEKEASDMLREATRRFPNDKQPETFIRHGQPATEILIVAKIWHADLIVLGTHKRGRLSKLFVGSTASAVVRGSVCPVVVVPGPSSAPELLSTSVG